MTDRREDQEESGGCNHSGRLVDVRAELIRCGCGDYSIALRDYVEEHYDLLTEVERLTGLLGQSMAAHTVNDTAIATLREALEGIAGPDSTHAVSMKLIAKKALATKGEE